MNEKNDKPESHVISLLVSNKPGVLIRVALVFGRRGFNIDSLVVSPTHDPKFSRMTMVASGDLMTLRQIIKQLNKLVDVIHAQDHTGEIVVERELALIKVKCNAEQRTEILQITEHFKGETVDLTEDTIMIEATGSSELLNAMMVLLEKFEILETVRSGKLIMARGHEST